jgi:NTP pyrophosphatase (non-canonical NTP hydrolase)
MNLKEYSEGVMRTVKILENPDMNQLHMVLGMVTETGELADVFKKYHAYNKVIDWVNVQEEVGDLLFYISAFCFLNNFDLEKILEQNLSKLKIRYPDTYTDEKAQNRDLDREKQILTELGY